MPADLPARSPVPCADPLSPAVVLFAEEGRAKPARRVAVPRMPGLSKNNRLVQAREGAKQLSGECLHCSKLSIFVQEYVAAKSLKNAACVLLLHMTLFCT